MKDGVIVDKALKKRERERRRTWPPPASPLRHCTSASGVKISGKPLDTRCLRTMARAGMSKVCAQARDARKRVEAAMDRDIEAHKKAQDRERKGKRILSNTESPHE